jgi:hypothetical protein
MQNNEKFSEENLAGGGVTGNELVKSFDYLFDSRFDEL